MKGSCFIGRRRLWTSLNEIAGARGISFQATGCGSLIGWHFCDGRIRCAADADRKTPEGQRAQRAAETLLHLEALNRGYYFSRRGYLALSLPTTAEDCESFVGAVDAIFSQHQLAFGS